MCCYFILFVVSYDVFLLVVNVVVIGFLCRMYEFGWYCFIYSNSDDDLFVVIFVVYC